MQKAHFGVLFFGKIIVNLVEQLAIAKRKVATNSYSMSVGEIVSMYKDGDLILRPDFQRFFRWSDGQKSRLIESLLLGLPIPPIFVVQDTGAKWEIIDGLQRISTILEVIGVLKNKNGDSIPQFKLHATKYLPDLEGTHWNQICENDLLVLDDELKLSLRRSRVDVNIIIADNSDIEVKYELFDRLNTGASFAVPQEVRNCLLIMQNESFFNWLSTLSEYENFKNCIPLTEKQLSEQFDLELLVRYLVLQNKDTNTFAGINDLHTFLNDEILKMASDSNFDRIKAESVFKNTFDLLNSAFGEDVFRKFVVNENRHKGPISLPAFESVAISVAEIFGSGAQYNEIKFKGDYNKLWSEKSAELTSVGVRASSRIANTIQAGRDVFLP